MIANGYTNSSDGLWKPSNFQAGNWELSIGRWAWLFLDKFREGIDYVYENRMHVVIQLRLVCLLMTVGLGLYQANVGCYCVIILFYCAKLILEDKAKNAFRLLNTSIVCFMVSCVAYKILWDVALKLRHTDPSWYKGIGNLTVFSIIFNIPIGILNSYNAFAEYYFTQMSNFFPCQSHFDSIIDWCIDFPSI